MWWSRREREIEKELRFHIENQVEDNLRAGMTPGEARRQAILLFGGPARIREECRELRPLQWLETLWGDVRYALRTLRASPVFASTAVASIALGIGVNAAIFTLLHAALWKPLPVPRSGELFHLMLGEGAERDWSYSSGALAAGKLVQGLLFGMSAADPWVLGAAALTMVAVALIAGWFPAARAARIDPNSALRQS